MLMTSCFVLRTEKSKSTPIGRGRGLRYGLPNQEYYFQELQIRNEGAYFKDLPQAIASTKEIFDKIESFILYFRECFVT